MTRVYQFEKHQDQIEEAGDWLARIDRGMTGQDYEMLQNWLAKDSANPETLVEVARMWDKLDSLGRLAAMFPEPMTQKKRTYPILAIAATFLIAMVVTFGSIFFNYTAGPNQRQVFQTAVGEKSSIDLPDGSEMELNTYSKVRIAFNRQQRTLFLDRGEIFLHVAPDRSRPLRVYAGGKFVEALGTAFNVKITPSQAVELIVTEGKVLVGVHTPKAANSKLVKEKLAATEKDSSLLVSTGEMLLYSQNSDQLQKMKPEEIAVKLSWQGGNIVFQGESLEEALKEIERYTPVEFVILDDDLKSKRVIGLFKSGDVDGLLATLRQNFDIVYEYVSKEKVVLRNAIGDEKKDL